MLEILNFHRPQQIHYDLTSEKKVQFLFISRIYRVFDQMSRFIETRTSLQCRSHHQKAIERHKQVKEII